VGHRVSLASSLTGEAACPSETVCCSTSSSSVLLWITHVRSGGPLPAATSESYKCCNPSAFALRLTHLGTLVTGRFTRIWEFHSSPTTSEYWLRVSTKVSWCGEPLSSATWKALVPTKGCWSHPRWTEEGWWSAGQSRLPLKRRPSRRNE
jgi:hypothetical protein